MKQKFILVLAIIFCFAQIGYCIEQGTLGSKIQLKDASFVSKRANGEDGYSSSGIDPIMNSMMNGMGNMMQGMAGNYSNIQSVQEQMKMQRDYIKQGTPAVTED